MVQSPWAQAAINGDAVVVWNPSVRQPRFVRYAWADNPECNLYNGAGLPASPFRTDN
jgi:sialate O-acetylesterase